MTDTLSSLTFTQRPGLIERVVAATAVFVFAFSLPFDWFVRVRSASAGTNEGGGALTQVVFLTFAGVAVLALMNNWHMLRASMMREPLLPALIGLAVLSTVWATNIPETFTTGVIMSITLLVAYWLVVRFSLEEILLYAGLSLGLGVFINYAFIFVFQDFGLDTINVGTDGGAKWSGVFVTKNELGRIAVLSSLVFAFNARLRRSLFVWPTMFVLSSIQVLASDSATSLGAFGGLLVLAAVFLGFRARKTLYGATAVALTTVFSILTLLAATDLAAATGLLGKDSSFTGRAPLWVDSFRFGIAEKRWFGYGWRSFWTDESSFEVQIRSNFDVPHAHNAFVDAWLFVGPIGSVLLIAIFIRGLIWGARTIRAKPTAAGLFPILMISYALIFSLTEAGVVRRDISLLLFTIACVLAAEQKYIRRPFLVDEPDATVDDPVYA